MRISHLLLATALAVAAVPSLAAADGAAGAAAGIDQPTPEYLAAKAELEAMLAKRDLELFEVNFEALALDRILVTDRLGANHVYHYLAFRVRNQAGSTGAPISQAKGYNDVLAAMAAQYEQAKVVKGDGAALTVEAADPQDGVIIERRDARTSERSLDITVLATNEHGSRIRLLDDPVGSGPQDSFNFPDLGEPLLDVSIGQVRDRVEEVLQRKLLTLDEIRTRRLPPYDATKVDADGWAQGELYGVVVFHRLSDYGKQVTIQVRGLSNKFRERWPATEPNKVGNYLEARFFRRLFVLHYDYPGDEYYRDLDHFTLAKAGWEWVPTFQRNAQRRIQAYSRYYLDNITADNTDTLNQPVEDEFWADYAQARTQHGDKLPDLQAELKR